MLQFMEAAVAINDEGGGSMTEGETTPPPAEMGARQNEENERFVSACHVCEETGHRSKQCTTPA